MSIRLWTTIVVCILPMAVTCVRQMRTFEVSRTSTNQKLQQNEKVADLSIITDKESDEASAEIQLVYEALIDSASIRNPEDEVILTYLNAKTGQEFKQRIVYDRLMKSGYKEILSIIVNPNYDIISINYSQQKLKRNELGVVQANIHKNQQAKQYVLTYAAAKTAAQEQQDESFFAKYKWYILGFVAILFMMSKADPEALQAQMQQTA